MVTIVKGMKLSSGVIRGNIRKIHNFVRTNAAPAHQYGRTIVGSDPKVTDIHKSTIAAATGHMSAGASRALAIQLSFGMTDQPEVSKPMASIRA